MKHAVALQYDAALHETPIVLASGDGELARRIERAAIVCGVPVVRDAPLAGALLELAVGDPIPEALYESVAAILGEIAAVERGGP